MEDTVYRPLQPPVMAVCPAEITNQSQKAWDSVPHCSFLSKVDERPKQKQKQTETPTPYISKNKIMIKKINEKKPTRTFLNELNCDYCCSSYTKQRLLFILSPH